MTIFYDDITKTWYERNQDQLPTKITPKTEYTPKNTEDVPKKTEDEEKNTEDFKNVRGVNRQRITVSDDEYSVRPAQVLLSLSLYYLNMYSYRFIKDMI
jgi:hypothetical protein